jgi:tRNA (guanine37-N1)-methyltransferase
MRIDFLTLFPQMCETVMSESIIGRACKKGILEVFCHNIRDYTTNRQNQVDDYPYGGGTGMIMQAQPIYDCFKAVCEQTVSRPYVIYLSPQGKVFKQEDAVRLSEMPNIAFLCGHYEGVDERIIEMIVDEELSIGDFVLTGGELPALVMADAVSRIIPGVLASEESWQNESISSGLLEYPQYSRPAEFMGQNVPEVLISGHHANIQKWCREMSLERTLKRRPDLLETAMLSEQDIKCLEKMKAETDKKENGM